jgi:hypothetical protein
LREHLETLMRDLSRVVPERMTQLSYVQSQTGFPQVRGLKTWQEWEDGENMRWQHFPDSQAESHIKTIMMRSDGNSLEPLTADEIDALCERLNALCPKKWTRDIQTAWR